MGYCDEVWTFAFILSIKVVLQNTCEIYYEKYTNLLSIVMFS